MVEISLFVVGPDRFCEFCGRWLTVVHDNGTFDLAGQTSVTFSVVTGHENPEAVATEATCMLPRCKRQRAARG